MSQLRVTVPVSSAAAPTDPDVLALLGAAISRETPAWTAPVYQGETTNATGTRLFIYLTDAQPRSVTTANVAPELRPARVL